LRVCVRAPRCPRPVGSCCPCTGPRAFADGKVTLTPAAGIAGSRITLHGTGFPAVKPVRIAISGRHSTIAHSDRARKALTLPWGRRGWLKIISTSGAGASSTAFVLAVPVAARRWSRPPQAPVRVSGSRPRRCRMAQRSWVRGIGFQAGDRLRLTWPGTDRGITVGRGGRFAANSPLPDTLGPGTWLGRVVGRGIRLTFRVDVQATSGGGPTITINPPVAGAPTTRFPPASAARPSRVRRSPPTPADGAVVRASRTPTSDSAAAPWLARISVAPRVAPIASPQLTSATTCASR